jgi:hypothetical protein
MSLSRDRLVADTSCLGDGLQIVVGATFRLLASGVLHGIALVKYDCSVEIRGQPMIDLARPRNRFLEGVVP